MFKPHKAVCNRCLEFGYVVVKAMLCHRCNEELKREKKGLSKVRASINKRSNKRAKQEALYLIINRQYLKDHPKCEANIKGICSGNPSNQVHHKKGRIGDLLLDTKYFLAVEDNCHHYIENHPEFAYENGFSVSRLTND